MQVLSLTYGAVTNLTAGQMTAIGTLVGQQELNLKAKQLEIEQVGQLASGVKASLNVEGKVTNKGLISAETLGLYADSLDNSGQVQAGEATFQTRILQNQGDVTAVNGLSVQTGALDNSGRIASAGELNVQAERLNGQDGELYGRTTTIRAGQVVSTGQLVGQERLTVTADQLHIGQDDVVASVGETSLTAEKLTNAGEVTGQQTHVQAGELTNSGKLQGQQAIIQAEVLTNSGQLAGQADLSVTADQLTNSGLLVGEQAVTLKAEQLQQTGQVVGTQLNVDAATLINSGQMAAIDRLTLKAGQLQNAQGGVISGKQVSTQSEQLTNQGTIAAEEALQIDTGVLTGAEGTLYGRTAAVTAKRADSVGTMIGETALNLDVQDLNIEAAGQVVTQGTANVKADTLSNAGQLQAD